MAIAYWCRAAIIIAMFVSANTSAADPSPDELGAFASPQAFAEACTEAMNPPAITGDDDDANAAKAMVSMAAQYCIDMVNTVATVARHYGMARPLKYDGPPICLEGSKVSPQEVIDAFTAYEAGNREAIKASGATTPEVLLPLILHMTHCPPGQG